MITASFCLHIITIHKNVMSFIVFFVGHEGSPLGNGSEGNGIDSQLFPFGMAPVQSRLQEFEMVREGDIVQCTLEAIFLVPPGFIGSGRGFKGDLNLFKEVVENGSSRLGLSVVHIPVPYGDKGLPCDGLNLGEVHFGVCPSREVPLQKAELIPVPQVVGSFFVSKVEGGYCVKRNEVNLFAFNRDDGIHKTFIKKLDIPGKGVALGSF